MTLQQRAYGLIDRLPDESVSALIQVMTRMLPHERGGAEVKEHTDGEVSPKMKAYLRMRELRKETAKYDLSEAQRAAALDEKYGRPASGMGEGRR